MKLSEVSIRRPVLATVMSLVIVLLGLVSMQQLPNRLYPDVEAPVVSVTTVLPGAAPEVVETSVTQPLEDQLIAIEGVKHVTSLSREQVSAITVEFELWRDVDAAANDVRDRVARARNQLPDDTQEPIVAKRDADAWPILWLALFGDRYSQLEISDIAETLVQDRLGKLAGVSEVMIAGERRPSMRIWLDNARMTAHNVVVADVAAALARENVDIPSGRVEGRDRELTVRTLGELSTPEEYGALTVAVVGGEPVRLRDIAEVERGAEDDRKIVRFNGLPAVGLGVVKQSKANTLDVVDLVMEELEELRAFLPPGLMVESAFDTSIFIRQALADVSRTIVEAIILVVTVIFLFLRNFRATVIPAVTIPISLIGTFSMLHFLGFSMNTLTLMGLTLAIGLVVDDAIVVLENISRWVEKGTPPLEAAQRGMNEIAFAVITATISVVAVFMPLAYLTDTTGLLFREFGLTVATAVAISGFVALTLSPMLCARILRPPGEERGVRATLARGFDLLATGYAKILFPAVRRRGVTLAAGFLWVLFGVGLFMTIDTEFIPTEDRGAVRVFTRAPEGSTIDYTERYQLEVEEIVMAIPEVAKAFSVVALGIGTPGLVNEGGLFASLHPWNERSRSQMDIVDALHGELSQVAGIQAFPMNLPPLGQASDSAPISLVIQGPDVRRLAEFADEIIERGRQVPGVVGLRSNLILNKPQIEVKVDRERASDLGVSVRDIASTLQILFGGLDISTYKQGGETYKVMAQLQGPDRAMVRDLYAVFVRGRDDPLIPLGSVVTTTEAVTPRGLPHFNRARAATITGQVAQGTAMGPVLREMIELAEDVLPAAEGYRLSLSGESESYFESGYSLLFAYVFAVILIFLVLSAQFESFLHPVIILVAVALSFTGGLLGLWVTGSTLNLFSEIGLVMLVGLVTKNSILIVEFANQLREAGLGLVDATVEAARTRFRPILMTAMSTIVGILPIAIGAGTGGESRAPLGIAVVGGMLFASALTVFVVPATYVAVESLRSRLLGAPASRPVET